LFETVRFDAIAFNRPGREPQKKSLHQQALGDTKNAGSATKAAATTAAISTAIASTVATAVAATTMAATAAGQAVDAGAGRVGLAAGAHGLAVGQVKARKLCGLQGVDVAWQFVIVVATVLTAALSPALWTTARTTAFRTWTTGRGTALAIAPVVKAWIAALVLSATAVTTAITVHAFAATIALAFKTRCALGGGAA
jgi:hypothetical protein